jgi:uncharacterized protein YigA (DUF484 family)
MKIELDANDVAAYLKAHPDFFNLYADLLAQIVITDPHNGRAVSITERQLGALRDRNKQLEAKLAELIRFGEENDVISEKLHELTVALMGAETFAAVSRELHESLGGAFAVPHVALRLWDMGALATPEGQPEPSRADAETRNFAATLKHPYCGPSSGLAALAWLGSGVRSLALVPLRQGTETIGLLTLGSEDIQRFYPEMGTLFLERIGELVAAALLRTLDPDQ